MAAKTVYDPRKPIPSFQVHFSLKQNAGPAREWYNSEKLNTILDTIEEQRYLIPYLIRKEHPDKKKKKKIYIGPIIFNKKSKIQNMNLKKQNTKAY